MKTALTVLVVIISGVFFWKSYIFPGYTVIHFENNSKKVIDSAIIQFQKNKIKLFNIAPQGNIYRKVPKDSIATNKHEIIIRIYLFDKDKSNFKDGFYYDDLSGYPNNRYRITLNDDLKTVIR